MEYFKRAFAYRLTYIVMAMVVGGVAGIISNLTGASGVML